MIVIGNMGEQNLVTDQNKAMFEKWVADINAALDARRPDRIVPIERAMLAYVKANGHPDFGVYNLKRIKTEFVRIYVMSGAYKEAVRLATTMLTLTSIDITSPNRKSVVYQVIGRIHMEAGNKDKAREALRSALRITQQMLDRIPQVAGR